MGIRKAFLLAVSALVISACGTPQTPNNSNPQQICGGQRTLLDSTFDCPESLKGYSVHPDHVAVANGRVRPYTAGRYCLDYED